jgi:hypothetical protein
MHSLEPDGSERVEFGRDHIIDALPPENWDTDAWRAMSTSEQETR